MTKDFDFSDFGVHRRLSDKFDPRLGALSDGPADHPLPGSTELAAFQSSLCAGDDPTAGRLPNTPVTNISEAPANDEWCWTTKRRLSDRFFSRMGLASARVRLDVDPYVRFHSGDDRTWAHSQAKGAVFLEAATADPRWLLGAEGERGDFAAMACAASGPRRANDLLLTLGLGGALELPSHRMIATIDPIFALAERFRAANFGVPMIRIFKADSVAAVVNKFDREAMADVSAATMAYIEAFAARFYPAILPRVSLCIDDPSTVADLMERTVRPISTALDLLPEMAALGRDRSSEADAMAYGVAHAFHMGALLPPDGGWSGLWRGDIHNTQPRGVICIGGKPERLFVQVMNLAVANAGGAWRRPPRVHLITRLAHKPAYAPYPDEPRINAAIDPLYLKSLTQHERCGADWKVMQRDHRFPDLLDFMGRWAK